MAVSKRLRFEVLRRDNHTCRYCGAKAPDVSLTVDHVIPEALGGSDDPSNLVTACDPCNTGKTSIAPDSPIVDDVAADAERWAQAMTLAAEMHRAARSADHKFVRYLLDADDGRIIPAFRRADGRYDIPRDYARSIIQFRDAGLDETDLIHAAETMRTRGVSDRDRWKYFCGVAWRMIDDRLDVARRFVEAI